MRAGLSSTSVFIAVLITALGVVLDTGVNYPRAEDLPDASAALREFPDDPPGTPAQPVPGAPPAQQPTFRTHVNTQANVAPGGANIPGDAANEPSIAVDPTDPLRIAIGWRQFDTVSSNFRQAGWAYSEDGGRTWTFPGSLDPGNFRSDPVLSFDTSGNFYYNSLEGDFTCDVFKSLDGGMTWGPPVYSFGGDKEWLAVDRSGGIGHGHLYSYWAGSSNTFTRSVDGGQSFQNPVSIPNDPRWGTMDVAPDGTLYLCGVDWPNESIFLVSRSVNAQDESQTPTFVTEDVDLGGAISLYPATNPGGLASQPIVAVDPSDGPTAGYIYLLCGVDPPGSDPLDVHFVRSTDGGVTWSSPIRVNDDSATNAWQWFATMSVAPNGRLDVIWNDTRNTGAANWSELFYSSSADGGLTWSANEQLSTAWNSHIGWPQQEKIGDYYDMVSDLVGSDLAWAATFNDEQDVYHLRIGDYDCNQNGIGDSTDIAQGTSPDGNDNGIPDECEGVVDVADVTESYRFLRNVPNPFHTTTIEFALTRHVDRVRLRIFNVDGRLVRTLVDGPAPAGATTKFWDGTDSRGRLLAPGFYFYRLEAPGVNETRRMLLLR